VTTGGGSEKRPTGCPLRHTSIDPLPQSTPNPPLSNPKPRSTPPTRTPNPNTPFQPKHPPPNLNPPNQART